MGTSFLIASGASNGAQRGASYLGPRVAWANAALAKANLNGLSIEGFWLKPNDAPAAATGTRLSGVNIEGPGTGPLRAGAMYVYAETSNIVTRNGLNVYDLRARWHPVTDAPHFWIEGEAVWQHKSGVDANGWYVEATYNASTTRWTWRARAKNAMEDFTLSAPLGSVLPQREPRFALSARASLQICRGSKFPRSRAARCWWRPSLRQANRLT